MNPIKRLAGQAAIYGLSNIVGRLLNYLLIPIYTRIFLPEEYGVVTELYSYVALFYVVLSYGMGTAFFRFSGEHKEPLKVFGTALYSVLISSIGFAALGILFAPFIASGLGYAQHVEYIRWFVVIIAADAFTTIPFARLRQENKALRFALVKLVNIGTNVLLNVFFLLYCPYVLKTMPGSSFAAFIQTIYNPQLGVGYIFIINLATSLLTLVLLAPELKGLKYGFDKALWRRMMIYALPLLVMGLSGTINESFDRILLKHLLPDKSTAMAQLGIYGACYKISILMTLFVQTFGFAAEPFFFGEAKKKDARATYARVMDYFVIVCLFIFLSVMVYIEFVKGFVGKDFYSGLHIVPILLLANMFLGMFYNLSVWYKLTNKTGYGAWVSLSGSALTLVANFVLIPLMGYTGSAWAHFICYLWILIISYLLGQKYYPVPYKVKRILFFTFLAVGLYFLNLWLLEITGWHFMVTGTLILAVFLGVVLGVEYRTNRNFRAMLPFFR